MYYEEHEAGMAEPRRVDVLLRGDPVAVELLRSTVQEFMKKQEKPSWEPK